jgi:antitoxin HigA-1
MRAEQDRGETRHPGEVLKGILGCFRELTQADLADHLRISRPRLNGLLQGRRGITPDTALRLEKFFGVSAAFWLRLQARWDLHSAAQSENTRRELVRIPPFDGGAEVIRLVLGKGALVGEEEIDEAAAPYFREYLAERGLLPAARRYAALRAVMDRMGA